MIGLKIIRFLINLSLLIFFLLIFNHYKVKPLRYDFSLEYGYKTVQLFSHDGFILENGYKNVQLLRNDIYLYFYKINNNNNIYFSEKENLIYFSNYTFEEFIETELNLIYFLKTNSISKSTKLLYNALDPAYILNSNINVSDIYLKIKKITAISRALDFFLLTVLFLIIIIIANFPRLILSYLIFLYGSIFSYNGYKKFRHAFKRMFSFFRSSDL